MKVLITGGTGFLGRAVVAAEIDAGHEVHVTARGAVDVSGWGVHCHQLDLLAASDEELQGLAAIGFNALVHCAWVTDPAQVWQGDLNSRWVEASERLVLHALRGASRAWWVLGAARSMTGLTVF